MSENETPVLPEGNQEGTTARLFPETTVPVTTDQPKEEKVEETQVEPEVTEPITEPDYLDVEAFGEKKVKVKIAGQESEVNLRELLKGYQTEQYLTLKGQQIAEERRRLEEVKAPPKPEPVQANEDPLLEVLTPYVKPLQDEIVKLNQHINQLSQVAAPLQHQQAIDSVDAKLKQDGYTDFKDYLPKLRSAMLEAHPQVAAYLDTPEGATMWYLREKGMEMMKALKNPQPKTPESRPAPKVVPIESGTGTPSGQETIDMAALFERARKTGDWTAVYEAKGYI